jgi:hypothetical protein
MNTTSTAHTDLGVAMALLNISGLRLALPQNEIRSIETAADTDTDETKPFSVGWVNFGQERWPVYCLSPELELLLIVPKARRSCAVLDTGAGHIGILCDEASQNVLIAPERQHPLPPPMRTPNTPITGLIALDGDEVACATSAERLIAHVNLQVNL